MPPRKPDTGPEGRIPRPADTEPAAARPTSFEVNLPGGGSLNLNTSDEVVMWNETRDRYIKDFKVQKQNDLMQLGSILSLALMQYRAQRELADPKKAAGAVAMIEKCAEGIRKGEKALGIDRATREKGGTHNVHDYLTNLKKAAYMKGVHLSDRVKAYEAMAMDVRWKIRLLRNGDAEDKAYHGISETSIVAGLEKELARLEELDKVWARERGAIWVGKL